MSDDSTSRLLQTKLYKDERFQPKAGVYKITVPILRVLFQTCASFYVVRENAEKFYPHAGNM